MWGRGGEGHEEEEPAKKQKWQVLWAGVESRRREERGYERGLGHQFEIPQRGQENGWQEGIKSTYLYPNFPIHGLCWSA